MTPAQQKEALELLEHARNALRQPNMDSALAILIDELLEQIPEVNDDDDDPFS